MHNNIRTLREARGLTRRALAERVGTGHSQIVKLERGERRLTDQWLGRIARALECPIAALIGEGPGAGMAPGLMSAGVAPGLMSAGMAPGLSFAGTERASLFAGDDDRMLDIDGQPFMLVGLFDLAVTAGPGSLGAGNGRPLARRPVALEDLQRLGAMASRPALVLVRGDAMAPQVRDGDVVLVCLGHGGPEADDGYAGDGLYLLGTAGGPQVRRVAMHPVTRRVTVSCDNPAYPDWPDLDPAAVEWLGRALWGGRRLA